MSLIKLNVDLNVNNKFTHGAITHMASLCVSACPSAPVTSPQEVFDCLEGQLDSLQRQSQALIRQILLFIDDVLMRRDPHQGADDLVILIRFHVALLGVYKAVTTQPLP